MYSNLLHFKDFLKLHSTRRKWLLSIYCVSSLCSYCSSSETNKNFPFPIHSGAIWYHHKIVYLLKCKIKIWRCIEMSKRKAQKLNYFSYVILKDKKFFVKKNNMWNRLLIFPALCVILSHTNKVRDFLSFQSSKIQFKKKEAKNFLFAFF